MSGMNEFLAQFYGTNGSSVEEPEKTASADEAQFEMFAKLASENGIDLNSLSDAELEKLYNDTFSKTASETTPAAPAAPAAQPSAQEKAAAEEQEKKAAAEAEFAEKQAAQQKVAEADYLGRVMAHAYVNEMRKIAADAEAKTAAAQPQTPAPAETPAPAAQPEKTASVRDRLMKLAEFPPKKDEEKKDEKKEEKGDHDKDDKGEKKLPPWLQKKEASALDELAAETAIGIIHEYNKTASDKYDVKVAAERIAAVHTLGLRDSEKVASAQNAETATYVRALEYLEAAGYPVNWPQ